MDDPNNQPGPARVPERIPVSPFDAPTLTHPEPYHDPFGALNPVEPVAVAVEPVIEQPADAPVPVVEPQTVAADPAPAVQPDMPVPVAMSPSFVAAQAPEKQRSLVWLWVTLASVFFVGLIIAAVFFISKENADKTADSYTKAMITYVTKIHTDVDAAGTAKDAKKSLDTTVAAQPILKTAFLSSFSDKYTKAKSLRTTVDKEITRLTQSINELSGVDVYINHYNDNHDKIVAASLIMSSSTVEADVIVAMNDVLDVIKDAQVSTEKAIFPSELASAKKDLAMAYKDEAKAWSAGIDARKASDTAAYAVANASFKTATVAESEALLTIQMYYYTLAVERNELLEKFDSFTQDLK